MRGAHAAVQKGLEWCLDVPVPVLRDQIALLRARYADESDADLARRVYAGVAWKSAVLGIAAGMPGHPAIALPAACVETAVGFRLELVAAAKVALIYDPQFFDGGLVDADPLELLAPLFGGCIPVKAEAKLLAFARKQLTSGVLRWAAGRSLGRAAKAGRRVLKVVPLVGSVVGAVWNIVDAFDRGEKVIAHFEWMRWAGARHALVPGESSGSLRTPIEGRTPSGLGRTVSP